MTSSPLKDEIALRAGHRPRRLISTPVGARGTAKPARRDANTQSDLGCTRSRVRRDPDHRRPHAGPDARPPLRLANAVDRRAEGAPPHGRRSATASRTRAAWSCAARARRGRGRLARPGPDAWAPSPRCCCFLFGCAGDPRHARAGRRLAQRRRAGARGRRRRRRPGRRRPLGRRARARARRRARRRRPRAGRRRVGGRPAGRPQARADVLRGAAGQGPRQATPATPDGGSAMAEPIRVLQSFPHKIGAARICTTAWHEAAGVAAAGGRGPGGDGRGAPAAARGGRGPARRWRAAALRIPYKALGRTRALRAARPPRRARAAAAGRRDRHRPHVADGRARDAAHGAPPRDPDRARASRWLAGAVNWSGVAPGRRVSGDGGGAADAAVARVGWRGGVGAGAG